MLATRCVLVVTLVAPWSMVSSCRASAPDSSGLALQERAAVALGPLPIAGALHHEDGSVWLWNRGKAALRRWRMASDTVDTLPFQGDIIAAAMTDEGLAVVDRSGPAVRYLTAAGRLQRSLSLPIVAAFDAIHVDGRWLVLGLSREGRWITSSCSPSNCVNEVVIEAVPREALSRRQWRLTVLHRQAFWVKVDTPFTMIPLAGGRSLAVSEELSALSSKVSEQGRWVLMPPVSIDTFDVVVLADLKSDLRVLASITRTMHVARSATIDAPLGLLSSNVTRRALVAARATTGTELVEYTWH